MQISQSKQAKESQQTLQVMQQDLITLAASLKGRLLASEKELLDKLFKTQMDLQALLESIPASNNGDTHSAEPQKENPQPDCQPEPDLWEIFTQLMLYAKLIYNETAGSQNTEAADYATEISRIVKTAQSATQHSIKLDTLELEPDTPPAPTNGEDSDLQFMMLSVAAE